MRVKQFAVPARKAIGCLMFLSASAAHSNGAPILEIANPANSGMYVAFGSSTAFGPATENPARATIGAVRAVVRQNGSQMIFSLEAEASAPNGFITSTGTGPKNPYFGSIPIEIGSSGGDSTGMPVTLTLTPNPGLNQNPSTTNILDGVAYSLSQPSVIQNLKVGDTFNYWVSMAGRDTQGGSLIVMLNVQSGVGASVPEPGTWTLLLAGMFPVAIFLLVKTSKYRAQKKSCCQGK